MERLNKAFNLASDLHKDQVRKGSQVPYISHLMGVAYFVLDNGGSEDQAIASLLHDAVEDQGGEPTLELIRKEFGDKVAELVLELSDAVGEPKPPWRGRKEAYLDHLAEATDEVMEIVVADKTCNLLSVYRDYLRLGDDLWDIFAGKKEGSLWYYHEVYNVLIKRADNFMLSLYKDHLDRLDEAIKNHK